HGGPHRRLNPSSHSIQLFCVCEPAVLVRLRSTPMKNQTQLSTDDDDFPDIPDCNADADKDAASVLATAALEKALNKRTRSLLKQTPRVFIFEIPNSAWIDPI